MKVILLFVRHESKFILFGTLKFFDKTQFSYYLKIDSFLDSLYPFERQSFEKLFIKNQTNFVIF